jgi:starch synthase
MFLMPSRFEPCGLTQMYSLRYGTVPIVRSTGGLVDTVAPFDGKAKGTGFRFDSADGTALIWGIDQALAAYKDKKAWKTLQQNGMGEDFSWRKSAEAYVDLYRRARQKV